MKFLKYVIQKRDTTFGSASDHAQDGASYVD
jgi:hypothetical protein